MTSHPAPRLALLLVAALLTACAETEETHVTRTSTTTVREEVPPPVTTDSTTVVEETTPSTTVTETTVAPQTPLTSNPTPIKEKTGEIPLGVPVPGQPGFVTSPHAPNAGFVDVKGYPPGTSLKCPYTGKTFQVP